MHRDPEHRQFCTIELVAEGHASRCPGEECAFWENGCFLARIEEELDDHPDVAQILLDVRRRLEQGQRIELEEARRLLGVRLAAESPWNAAPPSRSTSTDVTLPG